ncbi:MAG TPA: hypothetical protein PK794_06550 [Armatimonadota bacterium]|nr:hypothetical protein [Armatimonadota bacterium]
MRVRGGLRWLLVVWLACGLAAAARAQETAPPPDGQTAPPLVSNDIPRLLELGRHLVWQNNPALAPPGVKVDASLSPDARNEAAAQALRTFRSVVTRAPRTAEAWLWLGIALAHTLRYSTEHPKGARQLTEADVRDALDAFRTAYERAPGDIACVSYFGDALMELRRDFDTARAVWDSFLPVAKDDIQRVTALTQAARACLNKAYFGKSDNTLSAEQAKQAYLDAQRYVARAANIVPKAACVRDMQALLQHYRKYLTGK